jgi:hypothetical protein
LNPSNDLYEEAYKTPKAARSRAGNPENRGQLEGRHKEGASVKKPIGGWPKPEPRKKSKGSTDPMSSRLIPPDPALRQVYTPEMLLSPLLD